MSDQAYREQCVATTTEVAAPMPGDDPATARIRPLLAHTRLETAQLRCGTPLVSKAWPGPRWQLLLAMAQGYTYAGA